MAVRTRSRNRLQDKWGLLAGRVRSTAISQDNQRYPKSWGKRQGIRNLLENQKTGTSHEVLQTDTGERGTEGWIQEVMGIMRHRWGGTRSRCAWEAQDKKFEWKYLQYKAESKIVHWTKGILCGRLPADWLTWLCHQKTVKTINISNGAIL